MQLTLPPEVLQGLPEPGQDGIITVTAGLKVGSDGTADLVSINDQPIDTDDEQDDDEQEEGSEDGSGSTPPDLGAMADDIYGRGAQQ